MNSMRGDRKILGIVFLLSLLPVFLAAVAEAGCGCNKPPPKPAAIIPSVASPGMNVTFFDPRFQPNQTWNAVFTSGGVPVATTGTVVSKRDITDPTGKTISNQLVVAVPGLPPGPTSIQISHGQDVLAIGSDSFVVIGKPVMTGPQDSELDLHGYSTAVGQDGTLYVAVGGLNHVCDPMQFKSQFDSYPLRFSDGDVLIFNWQGYFIDSLTPASHNHFLIKPPPDDDSGSNVLIYKRHSFQKYCADHRPGGPKQVDPSDPNWHLDGTPHVDYAIVIFAIAGHLDNGSSLQPGTFSAELNMETSVASGDGDGKGGGNDDDRGGNCRAWRSEQLEETTSGE